eukprot:TRINITY_DN219_c1_g2_i1.p1 TRINITY_DN219_c1_g2~~TRINITY_DN219_c1_g2_i1.p1  ORF type:complete len:445 (+),score=179.64 TRINITY_DN219_c1_g2_i1:19-1353(+)
MMKSTGIVLGQHDDLRRQFSEYLSKKSSMKYGAQKAAYEAIFGVEKRMRSVFSHSDAVSSLYCQSLDAGDAFLLAKAIQNANKNNTSASDSSASTTEKKISSPLSLKRLLVWVGEKVGPLEMLMTSISSCITLKSLILSGYTSFTEKAATAIGMAMKGGIQLLEVRFEQMKMDDAIFSIIVDGLQTSNELLSLTFFWCGITEGVGALSRFLSRKETILQELNLSWNEIGDVGCMKIMEGLKENKTLKKLNLKNCSITSVGAKTIAEFLSQDGIVIEDLDLGDNEIGDVGCAYLSHGIRSCLTLKKLNLVRCGITSVGVKLLSEFLSEEGNVVEEVALSKNKIGDEGKNYISNAVVNGVSISFSDKDWEMAVSKWKNELVPMFLSQCDWLCLTQDFESNQESFFHYLGVCLYPIAELLFPGICEESEEEDEDDEDDEEENEEKTE